MPTRHWLAAGVLLMSGLGASGVRGQEADCVGNLGTVEIRGNLNIAVGCRLTGTQVRGNVTLFAGGSLVARDVRIFGNVEGRRANFVDIDDSAIEGNLRLEEFVGDLSTLQRSDIGGNAEFRDNRSRLEIVNNDFNGNVRASRNRGGVLISGNSVDGDLNCSGNNPEPTGLGNRVEGGARGQCRDLQPGATSPPPPPKSPPPPTTAQPPPSSPPPSPPPVSPPVTQPPAARPPASSPPTTSPPVTAPPTSSTPPTPSAPPAATPTTSTPPAPTPPPAAATPTDPLAEDDGGAGAFGWPVVAFFLPLLAWRRFVRRRAGGA
jgi:type 1 fimbria pilin